MKRKLQQPALYIVLYSNFEGFCSDLNEACQMVAGFDSITIRHPETVWTHMFNPIHLVGPPAKVRCREVFIPYLLDLKKRQPATEFAPHIHMHYSMVEAMGIKPRTYPHVGLPAEKCNEPRPLEGDGYDVLFTAYTDRERSDIIDACCDSFEQSGLGRPITWGCGFSATTPPLQLMLEKKGFTTSFAAQVIPPGFPGISLTSSWYKLLAWNENISPLTRPYRVAKQTILPTHGRGPFMKRLVEVPLNTDQDNRPLFLHRQPISRINVLDMHYEMVRVSGRSSCVALGIHDVYAGDPKRPNPVLNEMYASLEHVRSISQRGDVEIRYATAAQVSENVFTQPELW